jgi:hypothetical protein
MADTTLFPVLSNTDRMFYPEDGLCPVCRVALKKGDQVAYLSSGAILLSKDRQNGICTKRLEAFLHVGVHGSDSDMRGSADISVVKDLEGGQFDLQWCSVKCMREWWLDLFQKLEQQVSESWKPDTRTEE